MVNEPRFNSLIEMEQSKWLADIKEKLTNDIWPAECVRCKQREDIGEGSMRTMSNDNNEQLSKVNENYLIVDVIIDTICNAACQICSSKVSSTYAKTFDIAVNKFKGLPILQQLPADRIVQLDILGGEPGASKKAKQFMSTLVYQYPNLQTVRINSNGSIIIPEVQSLLDKGVTVDLCFSMDGTTKVFEYCRWPIKWNTFLSTLTYYANLRNKYLNLIVSTWSSFSAFSIADLPYIIIATQDLNVPHGGAGITFPAVIAIQRTNFLTLAAKQILSGTPLAQLIATDVNDNSAELTAFIKRNDAARGINIADYL